MFINILGFMLSAFLCSKIHDEEIRNNNLLFSPYSHRGISELEMCNYHVVVKEIIIERIRKQMEDQRFVEQKQESESV